MIESAHTDATLMAMQLHVQPRQVLKIRIAVTHHDIELVIDRTYSAVAEMIGDRWGFVWGRYSEALGGHWIMCHSGLVTAPTLAEALHWARQTILTHAMNRKD